MPALSRGVMLQSLHSFRLEKSHQCAVDPGGLTSAQRVDRALTPRFFRWLSVAHALSIPSFFCSSLRHSASLRLKYPMGLTTPPDQDVSAVGSSHSGAQTGILKHSSTRECFLVSCVIGAYAHCHLLKFLVTSSDFILRLGAASFRCLHLRCSRASSFRSNFKPGLHVDNAAAALFLSCAR